MKNLPKVSLVSISMMLGIVAFTFAAVPGSQTYTLTSGTDYTYIGAGHPVDCPNGCKDLYYSTKALNSPAGTTITKVELVSRMPATKSHWYRCQVEASCGVEEFSDLNNHNQSCVGTQSCMVWRATDGRTGSEADTIKITWR